MLDDAERQHDLLLAQLDAIAATHIDPASLARFRPFLHHYYEMATPTALTARSPAQLFQIAWQHWLLTEQRAAGEINLKVSPPADDKPDDFASVSTVIEDMPFLMDSISMAIREADSAIDWSVHPLLRIRRDNAGRLQQVLGAGDDTSSSRALTESLIHMEFEALTDEQDYAQLTDTIRQLLHDLRIVVEDYPAMRDTLLAQAARLRQAPPNLDQDECDEVADFLRWLADGHFTFLGYARSRAGTDAGTDTGTDSSPHGAAPEFLLHTLTEHGLGLTRADARFADTDEFIAPVEELKRHAQSNHLLVVTKANARSPIHHPQYMDIISIKQFDANGTLEETHRFIGLFSLDVYINRPKDIPLIRRKAQYVIDRSRLPENSYSGKNLHDILHQLPRDELFQSSEDELYHTCMGIRGLRDRHQLRLFMRRDRYGRFYSCMVYLPRDRYTREMRDRIAQELLRVCNGLSIDRNVDFLRGELARIHYIVRTAPGSRIGLRTEEVEERLIAATRSWRDRLRDQLTRDALSIENAQTGQRLARRFCDAFPLAYTSHTDIVDAATDIHYLAQLNTDTPVLPRLLVDRAAAGQSCPTALRLYCLDQPVALSDVLPTLENFGLRVIRQDPTQVTPRDGGTLWIQAFDIQVQGDCALSQEALKSVFETAFLQCWHGETENDSLNQLTMSAGLDWRQVVCLRTLTRYLLQTGLPYSQHYMAELLAEHCQFARLLVEQFETRFDPQLDDSSRQQRSLTLAQALDHHLDAVTTLDGDRVLRSFLGVVRASLRTNYFQRTPDDLPKRYVSIKLNPELVPELPAPRPMFEAFVYSPEMEAIHLRGGKVARGGLRWSDRREDFRTEVLGLVKAQMVKNAIIVPVGAKGGFVVKRGDPTDREAWQAAGKACYRTFLCGLLDITDNRRGDDIVPPDNVVRYDDDDPYLVVAADKGTATFSDAANAVAEEYGFWLGDAFASGGSVGYDHKKMGITARGAWESVKRHFREAGKNIQETPFTVIGIGDMSGDVFGNGMLLSPHIRLLAAFNHLHIFIDPDPDTTASFAERQRLFDLPRSSWSDYDTGLISPGGGVWPRSAKSIPVSAAMRAMLDINDKALTPDELLNALLRAPVELLWNGGIGTYIKASTESHQEVGDRANDALRVNARTLRCQVIGEGGNLGVTQAGRVEFALQGGRINTDAIDNAGGVHSSDREVNIKIPLNALMQAGTLTRAQRDPLLSSMTDELAAQVLRDNAIQSLALSQLELEANERLDEHTNLMRILERDGLLVRELEYLPDDEALAERRTRGAGLTRPELAVLLAYSKIAVFDLLCASDVPDDRFFDRELLAYFPQALQEKYRDSLLDHRLRRQIIATILANAVVNRMGFSFVHRLAEDHDFNPAHVVKSHAMAHAIYDGDTYWATLDTLDNQVDAALQLRLYARVAGLLKYATSWLLNNQWTDRSTTDALAHFHEPIRKLERTLPDALTPRYRADWDDAFAAMQEQGVPNDVARIMANTLVLGSAPDIITLAASSGHTTETTAACYFLAGDRLNILWLLSAIINLAVQDKWQALARTNLREDTYRLHRQVTETLLAYPGETAEAKFAAWEAAHGTRIAFGIRRMESLQAQNPTDFMTLAVGVRELRKLRSLPRPEA
ncbi:NAD-glutamate dehydrogenase [Alcanivorax sp. JB21]|uniref:NAD-glutamate dehydrogenase n=1 Tax=Alcanivorax limicola TaxID=2874102 RepID=UPI001CBDC500|nr:NAD-glutamate dehydrogenase [Alcanivorax limicola]MBZ2190366.1 NAD-glutamate dehydrogenase [Alcanivorax limicola]